jgi:hypothetical protein
MRLGFSDSRFKLTIIKGKVSTKSSLKIMLKMKHCNRVALLKKGKDLFNDNQDKCNQRKTQNKLIQVFSIITMRKFGNLPLKF